MNANQNAFITEAAATQATGVTAFWIELVINFAQGILCICFERPFYYSH
jgi:uncharacterized protein (DUF1778 family)